MARWMLVVCACVAATVAAGAQPAADPTDAPLWHVAVRGRGLPAVDGQRVFALTNGHEVVALAIEDGRELWRSSTREQGTFTEGNRISVAGDVVVAGDWDLYAFDATTGAPRWEFHPAEGYGPGLYLGPAVDGRVFTGSPSGALYAIDAVTGRQRWRAVVEPDGPTDVLTTVFAPASNGSLVVSGYTRFSYPDVGGLVAVEAATGRERWRVRFPAAPDDPRGSYFAGGLALTDSLAMGAAGDGTIWAVDLATGDVRWSIPPLDGPFDGIITAAPHEMRGLTATSNRVVVGSLTGYLTAYDTITRREVWRLEKGWLGSLSWTSYPIVAGVVYVPWWSGFLYAIEIESGRVLWATRDYERGLSSPPAVSGDRVFAAGVSGIWALPAPSRHVAVAARAAVGLPR